MRSWSLELRNFRFQGPNGHPDPRQVGPNVVQQAHLRRSQAISAQSSGFPGEDPLKPASFRAQEQMTIMYFSGFPRKP